MIGRLRGTIIQSKPSELVIDVNGVGYIVSIPLTAFSANAGKENVDLYIYTHVREDQIRLFGFNTLSEKELFISLIHVSGIGPSIALSLLSGIDQETLLAAIRSGDTEPLTRVPGIGKAKAEKLIFECKRKFKGGSFETGTPNTLARDAIEALLSLGYDEKNASTVVTALTRENPEYSLELIIKAALAKISSLS